MLWLQRAWLGHLPVEIKREFENADVYNKIETHYFRESQVHAATGCIH